MIEEESYPPHRCNVLDYCVLDNEYRLLFCKICHKVIGYEKGILRIMKPIYLDKEHQIYKEKEYSEDILKDSV